MALDIAERQRLGLLEEIDLARRQIALQWTQELPNLAIIERLLKHIDYCKAALGISLVE